MNICLLENFIGLILSIFIKISNCMITDLIFKINFKEKSINILSKGTFKKKKKKVKHKNSFKKN